MPHDVMELRVCGEKISKWIRYTVSGDLYAPEGSFEFDTTATIKTKAGNTAQIWVNGSLEMTGLVDKVTRKTSRAGSTRTVTGRSLCSVLADSFVTNFRTSMPTNLPKLVAHLVKGLPFIGTKNFLFKGGSDKAKLKRDFVQAKPGDTVFDVLKKAANSQGFLFWAAADGTFIIDKPAITGSPVFRIIGKTAETNYIEGSVVDSIEDRHSEILIMGESQDDEGSISHVAAKLSAKKFPFKRPLVVSWNEEEGLASRTAKLRLSAEDAKALELEYTVPGHAQNGKNWSMNVFCKVDDESNEASGVFLIVSREFTLSKEEGPRTKIRQQAGGILL